MPIPKISQSLINDLCDAQMCPQYIKFKYVDLILTGQSDVMFNGNYFEYYVLGDTRDHTFPAFDNVNKKNLKPTKSAVKSKKIEYLNSKGFVFDDEPTKEYLDEQLELLPEDFSKGEAGKAQRDLDDLVLYAKNILTILGIDPSLGETQVRIESDTLQGHLDHVNVDFQDPTRKAIYDLKYTETKENDRWAGWLDFSNNFNARTQATHYVNLYHEKHGVWLPFYFLIFGKTKWAKIIKASITEEGLSGHDFTIESCKQQFADLEVNGFPAKAAFNKCVKCDFYKICEQKRIVPEVEEYSI